MDFPDGMMLDLISLIIDNKAFEDTSEFFEEAYKAFYDDFIDCSVCFERHEVGLVDERITKGREETFWHVISNEAPLYSPVKTVKVRNDDIERAKRVKWIKEIIENSSDQDVRVFVDPKYNEPRIHLWYRKEYVVVIIRKKTKPYFRLLTAFMTNREGKIKEFEELYKNHPYKADVAEATSNPDKP